MELKNKDGLYEMLCEWGYGFDDLRFKICELSESDKTYINENSKKKKTDWKGESEETDGEKYANLIILKTIKGWEGLTNNTLIEMLDGLKKDKKDGWKFQGMAEGQANSNCVIEFNPENLRMVAQNTNKFLLKFVIHYLGQVEELRKEELRAQLKN